MQVQNHAVCVSQPNNCNDGFINIYIPVKPGNGKSPFVSYPSALILHFLMRISQPSMFVEGTVATGSHKRCDSLFSRRKRCSQRSHFPDARARNTQPGNMRQPVIYLQLSKYPIISVWRIYCMKIHRYWLHAPQKNLKHSSNMSKLALETDSCASLEPSKATPPL